MPAMSLVGKTIRQRLTVALSATLLVSFVGSAIGYWALAHVASLTEQMYQNNLVTERIASDWYRNITNGVGRMQAVAVSSDPEVAAFFAPISAAATEQSNKMREELDTRLVDEDGRRMFKQAIDARQHFLDIRAKVNEAKKAGDSAQAKLIINTSFQVSANTFLEAVKRIAERQRDQLDEAANDLRAANTAARIALVIFASISFVMGIGLILWVSNSITKPLKKATVVADAIANYDLTKSIEPESQDETGQLAESLKTMQAALLKLISEVSGSVGNINTASSEIAAGNLDLSVRTEQTAISLQKASSSMSQLTDTVRQTADSAVEANQLVTSASVVAKRGGDVVSQVVKTMQQINDSSRRIEDIIGTIDGIAFQTNILALNAAVEAARAGEQGRGFAVVAAEVRSLAQRSAAAAKEIKELISTSSERVDTGTKLVEDAGVTMTEIVASVQNVSNIIAEITAATQEQSTGLAEVSSAVGILDEMTQQNSALVEESAAAAASLNEQSEILSGAVGVFRLTADATQAIRATPRTSSSRRSKFRR
jgi:methyl-accepting chemotaxis protein